ncbi:MAG TPA: SUF system NifU family Fe-S cluster assembly protein [Blastocatellia bacterium]|nr:SUF system NifU family Fe-S cluster assembly protein [Blastocatellia bacterium]
MSDRSRELYTEVINFHGSKPRNFKQLEHATRRQEGRNPLCGDHLTLYLEIEGEVIKDVGFQGSGCRISTASASMMTTAIKGKTTAEAETLFHEFQQLVKGELAEGSDQHHLGHLATAFANMQNRPERVKCAILSWHTLRAALEDKDEAISTE